jgi:hypothetical protein
MSADMSLPCSDHSFDVICMYSVITHQLPEDASIIFKISRREVQENGRLFFSAMIENGDFGHREWLPEAPTALSVYSTDLMERLLETAGWQILSFESRVPQGLPNQNTFLCSPK